MESKLTPAELDEMREGGKIWRSISKSLAEFVKPGITGKEINDKAAELFSQFGVGTAFYMYHNFPGNICISVNDCIIHGVGHDVTLSATDKVTLDIGFKHKSIFIDSAITLIVSPESNKKYADFIKLGKEALWEGIKAVKPNCTQGDIAFAIDSFVKANSKYSIIDGFVGHAIGKQLHLNPHIFNKGMLKGQGVKIVPGMVICIEPMLLDQVTGEYTKGNNGFDILSKEPNAMTCHWEHMVLIKEDGIEVITASPEEVAEYLG
ncbi:methionine aminopeptidase [Mycoplasma haemofelis Ohio2]|uniref:Methionine aminopeptidase n=1 Tax=Mycoplasma haemofelis (strain Ohio2) TaxID=859194 RepID=F6FHB5_MYCHI|nr:methionine aminopeptidase [Mycoplasma haemofelis Ohio2]